jgi:nitrogen regulatory protein P-II 1
MKKIEAIIQPSKFEDVKVALNNINFSGITVSQVMGAGRQKGWKEIYRGTVVDIQMLQKIKVELVVKDEDLERVISVIADAARTNEFGDGKIFVLDVSEVIRIRTGEHGEDAV